MPVDRQTNFGAGELSPYFWGRTDLEIYRKGCRTLFNYFLNHAGAAVSRPGTKALVQTRNADVVLVPFVYSDTQSYVLELGDNYLRVINPDNGATVQELVTPWLDDDLPALQWAQAGYVLTFTHPSQVPYELRAPVPGITATWLLTEARFEPPGDSPTDTSPQAAFFKDVSGNLRLPPLLVGDASLFVLDAQHPAREWKYMVSVTMRHVSTGETVETLPVQVSEYWDGSPTRATVATLPVNNKLVLYPDAPITLSNPLFGPLVGTLTAPANWEFAGINYYRGRGGLYGFIGRTDYAGDFVDFGEEPDYTRQPLRGDAPFQPASLPAYWPKPAAVTYFQQRRCFALEQRLSFSATDEWANHDLPKADFYVDSSPLDFTFVSRKREAARSLVGHRRLLIFTDTSVWSMGGADGALTPSSAEVRLEDEAGATSLMPLVVDGAVLYVRAKGRGVRALQFADSGSYQVRDVSGHSEHLFRDDEHDIVSWCYQRDPWGVVWAVRGDGLLLSLTHGADGSWGWARHETGGGDQVLSVCSIPMGRADVVFLAVKRGANTWLERMFVRDLATPDEYVSGDGDSAFAIDCASTDGVASGTDPAAVPFNLTVPAGLDGREFWVLAPPNAPKGPFTATGGIIAVDTPFDVSNDGSGTDVNVHYGLAFQSDLGLLNAPQAHSNQKTTVKVAFEVDNATPGLLIGEDSEHLHPWRSRNVNDNYDYPSAASILAVVNVSGAYRRSGRAFLRQSQPSPCIILGVARELDTGGT